MVRKNRLLLFVIFLFAVLGIFSCGNGSDEAIPLSIRNHSFEMHDPFIFSSIRGAYNNTVLEWKATQPAGTSLIVPFGSRNRFSFPLFDQSIPDGSYIIFTYGNGGVSQVLPDVLKENTTYKLEVDVGDSNNNNTLPDSYSLELHAGGLELGRGTAVPDSGEFTTISFEYVTKRGDPFGEPLEVMLLTKHSSSPNDTVKIFWDNVRGTATTIGEQLGLPISILE